MLEPSALVKEYSQFQLIWFTSKAESEAKYWLILSSQPLHALYVHCTSMPVAALKASTACWVASWRESPPHQEKVREPSAIAQTAVSASANVNRHAIIFFITIRSPLKLKSILPEFPAPRGLPAPFSHTSDPLRIQAFRGVFPRPACSLCACLL